MKKNVKTAIIIAIIILVPMGSLALLYFLKNKKEGSDSSEKSGDSENTEKVTSGDFPLKKGSVNSSVGLLQKKLNVLLAQAEKANTTLPVQNGSEINILSVDNIFGVKTLAVVKWHLGTESVTESQYKSL